MSEQARTPPPARRGREPRLADKVAWLSGRLGPGDESIETHFAWVFLAGDRAWKLRKPVRRDTMDYSTLEARHRDSEEETRLNRRLAPHVYLGTRPLTCDAAGRLAIDGEGEIVDWLVEMRRLDRERMLDVQLARRGVTGAELSRVAALLARFYAQQLPVVTDGAEHRTRLGAQVDANHRVLRTFDAAAADGLRNLQHAELDALRDTLEARAAGGRVVEVHGDLRPEHILLDEPPAVIDCLEFDRNLRIQDRAEELAFLELECARLGHPDAGRRIARECLEQLGDAVPTALALLYRSHRAATRAKLYVWRASEPDGGSAEQWYATARDYLGTALEAARAAPTSASH